MDEMNVNGNRLWSRLMEMAKIGETSKGGCDRQTLTDTDIQGRRLFATWCEALGLDVEYDQAGNMFARYQGLSQDLAPLVLGSHLDTQPTGGKFDGVLGVLSALEVLETLIENDYTPPRPIVIANWMNEEGARFAPAMMGSGVWSGALNLFDVRQIQDKAGITLGSELERHGYHQGRAPEYLDMDAYLELHIEQGPILEQKNLEIGVVTGAQGIRWYDVLIGGVETHAGPTPMIMRHDPVQALPNLIAKIYALGANDRDARVTIGEIITRPSSRNVVPGQIRLTVDLRHPDETKLNDMNNDLFEIIANIKNDLPKLTFDLVPIWHSPVVKFDQSLLASIRQAVERLNYSSMDIVSGAGHDALMVARRVPTAMIFVPCKDGISHNEAEHIDPRQAENGANVLLHATLNYLNSVSGA